MKPECRKTFLGHSVIHSTFVILVSSFPGYIPPTRRVNSLPSFP